MTNQMPPAEVEALITERDQLKAWQARMIDNIRDLAYKVPTGVMTPHLYAKGTRVILSDADVVVPDFERMKQYIQKIIHEHNKVKQDLSYLRSDIEAVRRVFGLKGGE